MFTDLVASYFNFQLSACYFLFNHFAVDSLRDVVVDGKFAFHVAMVVDGAFPCRLLHDVMVSLLSHVGTDYDDGDAQVLSLAFHHVAVVHQCHLKDFTCPLFNNQQVATAFHHATVVAGHNNNNSMLASHSLCYVDKHCLAVSHVVSVHGSSFAMHGRLLPINSLTCRPPVTSATVPPKASRSLAITSTASHGVATTITSDATHHNAVACPQLDDAFFGSPVSYDDDDDDNCGNDAH